MNIRRIFTHKSSFAVALAATLFGCKGDKEGTTGAGGADATTTTTTTTTGAGGGAGGEAQNVEVRIAHLSPDAPAVDFCLKREGQDSFQGPMLKNTLKEAGGLTYGQVTRYFPLREGDYTVRLVAPGAGQCEAALTGTTDVNDVEFDAGDRSTIAALGQLNPSAAATKKFTVKPFTEQTTAPAQKARLTFIHASPDAPEVDFGTGSGADFRRLFSSVEFGEQGEAEGKPYREIDPLTGATLSVRPSDGATDLLVIPGVDLPAGGIATIFAIGNVSGQPAKLAALVCLHQEQPAGALSRCSIKP
jgi:hypothetical protein